MKKNAFYTDQIFTRACIGSDYCREEDQLDAIYVENWPLSLRAHVDVECLNYLKVSVCFSVMKSVENVILSLPVCIADEGSRHFGPNAAVWCSWTGPVMVLGQFCCKRSSKGFRSPKYY